VEVGEAHPRGYVARKESDASLASPQKISQIKLMPAIKPLSEILEPWMNRAFMYDFIRLLSIHRPNPSFS
jgi:hypothetical protein